MFHFLALMLVRQKMRNRRVRCPNCGREHFYHAKHPQTHVYCRDCGSKIDLRSGERAK